MRKYFGIALALSTTLACGDSDEGVATSDQGVEVWPEAEVQLGAIEVVLPAADKPVDAFTLEFRQNMHGAPSAAPEVMHLVPGRKQQARVGEGLLTVVTAARKTSVKVDIASRTTATTKLGLASLSYQNPSSITGTVDFGRSRTAGRPTVYSYVPGFFFEKQYAGSGGFNGNAATYAPVAPIALGFTAAAENVVNPASAFQNVDFSGGLVRTVTLDRGPLELAQPGRVRFSWAKRLTPNAVVGAPADCGAPTDGVLAVVHTRGIQNSDEAFLATRSPVDPKTRCWQAQGWQGTDRYESGFVSSAMLLVPDQEVRMYPIAQQSRISYRLVLNPFFSAEVVPVEDTATEVRVERIDVHHVAVTHPDGTTTLEKGTYRISVVSEGFSRPVTGPGSYEPFEFPTETGVDVPPGRYKVQVRCNSSVDCATPRYYDLDLR